MLSNKFSLTSTPFISFSKSIIVAALLFSFFFTSVAFAKPYRTPVNNKAMLHFSENYKEANKVIWKTTSQFTKASFIMDGYKMDVFYSNIDGGLIATSKSIQLSELPENIVSSLKKQYSGDKFTFTECYEYINSDEEVNYYVVVNNQQHKKIVEINDKGEMSVFKVLQ